MKNILVILIFLLLVNGQSIAFLEEGININQPLSARDSVYVVQLLRSVISI